MPLTGGVNGDHAESPLPRGSHKGNQAMSRDLYAEVSNKIIAALEAGAAPWVKPWSATPGRNVPCNAATNRPYSGCNVVLLWMAQSAGYRTPRFLTFKQAPDLGGHVRKGEHGVTVFFVKRVEVTDRDSDDGETKVIPLLKAYTVFNVDQCDGLPERALSPGTFTPRNPDERDRRLMNSSHPPAPTSARASARHTTGRVTILSACRASKHSRARRIFTMSRFMRPAIGPATSRGLIATFAAVLAKRHMRRKNWSPSY